MAYRIRQWPDDVEELDDRSGPTMRQDQRQRRRLGGTDVQEVDAERRTVRGDLGAKLGEGVEPPLRRRKVVGPRPVVAQVSDERERSALRPVVDGLLVGPPRGPEPAPQVVDGVLSDVDPKGSWIRHPGDANGGRDQPLATRPARVMPVRSVSS